MSDWISVSQHLPRKGQAVIVAQKYWVDYDGRLPGIWMQNVYMTSWGESCERTDSNITHWMPVPLPPALKVPNAK